MTSQTHVTSVMVRDCLAAAAHVSGVTIERLQRRSGIDTHIDAKQAGLTAARKLTGRSAKMIGLVWGIIDHTTVLFHTRNAQKRLDAGDTEFARYLDAVIAAAHAHAARRANFLRKPLKIQPLAEIQPTQVPVPQRHLKSPPAVKPGPAKHIPIDERPKASESDMAFAAALRRAHPEMFGLAPAHDASQAISQTEHAA